MQIILVGQCYISVLNNLPDHEFISIYIRVYIHTLIDNINSFIDLMRLIHRSNTFLIIHNWICIKSTSVPCLI